MIITSEERSFIAAIEPTFGTGNGRCREGRLEPSLGERIS
jgi:hypothetical protein